MKTQYTLLLAALAVAGASAAHAQPCKGNRRDLARLARQQTPQPGQGRLVPRLDRHFDDRCGPQHQQLAQPFIAGSADAPQPLLAARRVLLRRQSQPGREVTAGRERRRIDLQRERQSGDRADAGDPGQQPAERIGLVRRQQLHIDLLQPRVEVRDLFAQQRQHRLGRRRKGGLPLNSLEQTANRAQPLRGDHPEFGGIAPQRVHQPGALLDEGVAHLQHHQLRLPLRRFDRHRVNVRPAGGFRDRFGVVAVVLAALDERLDILRRDQPQPVAQRFQRAGPVERTAARLHHDLGRSQLLEEGDQPRACQIQPQYRLIGLGDAVKREHSLGRVDRYQFILGHGRLRSWGSTAPSLARDAVGPSTPTSPGVTGGGPEPWPHPPCCPAPASWAGRRSPRS